jgi:dihydrofolate synthase/folylpolyglutamate synthase
MPTETLDAILARLTVTINPNWDLSLDRMIRLLGELGNPHLKIPPVIHIAGTNGKGSTTAFCRAILEAAGKTCHVYTSPHLVRFNERFRLGHPGGGRLATDEQLVAALQKAESVNDGQSITFFELITVAAYILFAEHPADYTILEVGLGGRLDVTNVIAPPLVSVITPISLDHEAYLGNTLELIAGEKAGIIKRGSKVVSAPQAPEVEQVLRRKADRERAPLIMAREDWHATIENGRLVYQDGEGLLDLPTPRLLGRHQYINAGTAIAAIRTAGIEVDDAAVATGMTTAEWPARMQRLGPGPLTELAVKGSEVWVDGGHNPGAGVVIAEVIADLEERVARPLFLIAGMLITKDPIGFFQSFKGLARHVITVPVHASQSSRPPNELANAARQAGLTAEPAISVSQAIQMISRDWTLEPAPRILICGSLYLAGEVLKANGMIPE